MDFNEIDHFFDQKSSAKRIAHKIKKKKKTVNL